MNEISDKANRILKFFLAGLALIFIQAWIAVTLDYESHLFDALKPMQKVVIEKVERGTIRDRFNISLAANQTQYNVAILYADIRTIPTTLWERDSDGKRIKRKKRKEYVEKLAAFLSKKLSMDPADIEDLIHGKACLFPLTPFILKEDISEEVFLQLKGAQKDWIGIEMQQTEKRIYPKGKLACDVIGYVGAISDKEYTAIVNEISCLRVYLEQSQSGLPVLLPKGFSSIEAVEKRLSELVTKSYTIHDHIGKAGIESAFDEALRGEVGKSIYAIDSKGNPVKKLSESVSAKSGQRLILTISAELQQEAEQLLTQYEEIQEKRNAARTQKKISHWQRGGAIVALDPQTGEILALASYPRFDPNDLVPAKTMEMRVKKRDGILKWLENLHYIGQIWDGKYSLERERWNGKHYTSESLFLNWEAYLDQVLSKDSTIYSFLKSIKTLDQAVTTPFELRYKQDHDLAQDILEMVVPKELFTKELLQEVGSLSIEDHRQFCQVTAQHLSFIKELSQNLFHCKNFRSWRESHFKEFLKQKRKTEKRNNQYARPYTEYLEKEEQKQFADYWSANRHDLFKTYLLKLSDSPYHKELNQLRNQKNNIKIEALQQYVELLTSVNQKPFIRTLRIFEDLNRPLRRSYPFLRNEKGIQKQRHLAAGFYPCNGFGYGRSQAFRQATPQGSVFKILTAYSGLMHQYNQNKTDLNPLTLIDDIQWTSKPGNNNQILGKFLDGRVIQRLYKGGRLPRAYPNIGKIGITEALERSSNIYFSILSSDILDSPSCLIRYALDFGLGNQTGIDLPGEYGGSLPDDLHHNKTGLYSFAIGQHSLVVTPLQTAMMLGVFANGGKLYKPQILKCRATDNFVDFEEPFIREELPLPPSVQEILLHGMFKVTSGEKGTARPELIHPSFHNSEAISAYRELCTEIAGKTGTAEIFFKQTLDEESHPTLEKHTWFGAAGYKDGRSDIVVVVYNRFGTAGKEGAPIAAKLIKKWRKIQKTHYSSEI